MNVSICDFEDSFTYNIYSQLSSLSIESRVIPFLHVKEFLQKMINSKEKHVIILGPGPGHPNEYLFLQETVLNLLKNENILVMGICLGHQLIWYFNGHTVAHSKNALHGQVQEYKLTKFWSKLFGKKIVVQRYNSLAVKLTPYEIQKCKDKNIHMYMDDDECVMSYGPRYLSYQFHPESVGTSCPEQFFNPIKNFLL